MTYLKDNNNTYIFDFYSYFRDPLIECSNLEWIVMTKNKMLCIKYVI